MTLDGQDKAFRDVIEPLESVSLSVAPTTRASLAEAGTPQEVAQNLVAKSSSPQAKTELVSSSQVRVTRGLQHAYCVATCRIPDIGVMAVHCAHPCLQQRTDANGVMYYTFEFTSSARGVTRHAVTSLAIANGKVFTLTVGASQARWPKTADRLRTVADSLVLLGY